MATLKENKGKGTVDEGSQPAAGEKRKSLSKNLDLGNLPSRRSKKAKQGLPKVGVVQTNVSSPQPSLQIFDVDSSTPTEITPSKSPSSKAPSAKAPSSKSTGPTSSQPQRAAMNLIENEDVAWERFQKVVLEEDIAVCYDMSLKDFEHSGVHDLFKGMSKFIAASRQATELDKTRILLEKRIQEVRDDSKRWAETASKAKGEVRELQSQIEELKAETIEKDARLEELKKKNNELSALLSKAKEDAVAEFQSSKDFKDLLDSNYAAGFEDFRMDAAENFPEVDFSSIKLNLNAATSSLLQTNSEDVNIEDDASTLPPQDDSIVDAPPS